MSHHHEFVETDDLGGGLFPVAITVVAQGLPVLHVALVLGQAEVGMGGLGQDEVGVPVLVLGQAEVGILGLGHDEVGVPLVPDQAEVVVILGGGAQ